MHPGDRYEVRGYGIVEILECDHEKHIVGVQRVAKGCKDEPPRWFEPSRLIPIAWPTVGHYGAR